MSSDNYLTTRMMSEEEIRTLPLGTLVETASGKVYRVQSVSSSDITLVNTKPRPAYIPPNAPLYSEIKKLTIKQASRLLVVEK